MAIKTDAELLALSTVIKDSTSANSNTAIKVGQLFIDLNENKINIDKIATAISGTDNLKVPGEKAVFDYVKRKVPFNLITGLVNVNFSVAACTIITNDFTNVTISADVVANGYIVLTSSSAIFNTTTFVLANDIIAGYSIIGEYQSPTALVLNIIKWDGTQTSTPDFQNVFFKIEIYS